MKVRTLSDDHINFWPSWADVLMIILIIMIFYIFIQYLTFSGITEIFVVRPAQEKMTELIKREFAHDHHDAIRIDIDGNFQIITFSDRILFDLGKADLKPQGQAILIRVGRILRENPLYSRIQVEGHTDDLPIDRAFRSNWELSSARATSVVRFLQDACQIPPTILSANGYSEYRPVVPNVDDFSRSLNRRIEIVLIYSTKDERHR